ncbi:unannotated protein [freshwater metagenome]|uniref:Unannotated protein n=1 Tax=freshwater metagenome TaxID=449393 RepID=A0A6J6L5J2_9ZZZZ
MTPPSLKLAAVVTVPGTRACPGDKITVRELEDGEEEEDLL